MQDFLILRNVIFRENHILVSLGGYVLFGIMTSFS